MADDLPLEFELHSYVDGTLDDDAMARIEDHLSRHPETATKVRDFLRQKAEINAFAQSVELGDASGAFAALERQLARRLKRRALLPWRRIAATAVLLTTGWLGHMVYVPLVHGPSFADDVVQAHMLTSFEPGESNALSPERAAALFAQIGEMQYLPDLSRYGYEPIGAQLMPSDAGAMLHVTYRSDSGTVVSYFLLHDEQEAEVPRHILHRNGVTLAYWQHDHSRYAVAALMADEQITELAAYFETAPNLFAVEAR